MEKQTPSYILAKLVTVILLVFISIQCSVFIVMKIVDWYNIPILLSKFQWFGLLGIIAMIIHKKNEKSESQTISEIIEDWLTNLVAYFLLLGIFYLYYKLLI